MKVELNIQIYAIANGVEGGRGVGQVRHKLDIITETDHLYLPVIATVLTAYEYDNRSQGSPEGGKSPGVKQVNEKPIGVQGITGLRKTIEGLCCSSFCYYYIAAGLFNSNFIHKESRET